MPPRDKLLTMLHQVQDRSGRNYLPAEDLEEVRRAFGLTRAEIRGVVTYYTMLSLRPRGRHLVRVCISPVCRMLGSVDLLRVLEESLGVEVGGTTADGLFTLEETHCLGRCAQSPAMMVDRRVYGKLTTGRVTRIIESLRRKHADA